MNVPENLKYTKDHEWIKVDGDIATIGITDFAQGELGDIVYIEIESEGEDLDIEEVFGTVEAVKTVSDLYMPLSGNVAEFNEGLEENPALVNEDPFGEGWFIKVRLAEADSLDFLMDEDEYGEYIKSIKKKAKEAGKKKKKVEVKKEVEKKTVKKKKTVAKSKKR